MLRNSHYNGAKTAQMYSSTSNRNRIPTDDQRTNQFETQTQFANKENQMSEDLRAGAVARSPRSAKPRPRVVAPNEFDVKIYKAQSSLAPTINENAQGYLPRSSHGRDRSVASLPGYVHEESNPYGNALMMTPRIGVSHSQADYASQAYKTDKTVSINDNSIGRNGVYGNPENTHFGRSSVKNVAKMQYNGTSKTNADSGTDYNLFSNDGAGLDLRGHDFTGFDYSARMPTEFSVSKSPARFGLAQYDGGNDFPGGSSRSKPYDFGNDLLGLKACQDTSMNDTASGLENTFSRAAISSAGAKRIMIDDCRIVSRQVWPSGQTTVVCSPKTYMSR